MSAGDYRDETRLEHMLRFANRIVSIAGNLTREELETAGERQEALIHNFIMLGEAANRITREYSDEHPEIAWRQITGMRHRLVHDYDEIDYDVLWEAMTVDIPRLLPPLTALVEALPKPPTPPNLPEFA